MTHSTRTGNDGTEAPRATRRQRWSRAALGLLGAGAAALVLKAYVPIGTVRAEGAAGGKSITEVDGASGARSFTTLREAMRDGLSPAFGEISVYAFHGMELDEEGFTSVAASAEALRRAALEIGQLSKRNFDADDRAFFEELAKGLGTETAALSEAAARRDGEGIRRLMTRIDSTCQSCHAKLAPHLSQTRE